MSDASELGQRAAYSMVRGTMDDAKQRTSKAEWLIAYRRRLLLWPLAVGFLSIVVAAVWPTAATASTLVAMTVAGIIGLVMAANWAAELVLALRERRGVTLFFLLFHAGTVAVFFGGSLLFLFAVLFTLGLRP